MITFNGKKFAKTDKEFAASLFDKDGTAYGYYKATKAGVLLMNAQRVPVAFLRKDNGYNFIVTASAGDSGKVRYMFSTTEGTEKALGIVGYSRRAVREQCDLTMGQLA